MARYLVETIGFNDGLPYKEFESDNLDEAEQALELEATRHKRVAHRLVEVLQYREKRSGQ